MTLQTLPDNPPSEPEHEPEPEEPASESTPLLARSQGSPRYAINTTLEPPPSPDSGSWISPPPASPGADISISFENMPDIPPPPYYDDEVRHDEPLPNYHDVVDDDDGDDDDLCGQLTAIFLCLLFLLTTFGMVVLPFILQDPGADIPINHFEGNISTCTPFDIQVRQPDINSILIPTWRYPRIYINTNLPGYIEMTNERPQELKNRAIRSFTLGTKRKTGRHGTLHAQDYDHNRIIGETDVAITGHYHVGIADLIGAVNVWYNLDSMGSLYIDIMLGPGRSIGSDCLKFAMQIILPSRIYQPEQFVLSVTAPRMTIVDRSIANPQAFVARFQSLYLDGSKVAVQGISTKRATLLSRSPSDVGINATLYHVEDVTVKSESALHMSLYNDNLPHPKIDAAAKSDAVVASTSNFDGRYQVTGPKVHVVGYGKEVWAEQHYLGHSPSCESEPRPASTQSLWSLLALAPQAPQSCTGSISVASGSGIGELIFR
ncbi:uncharacterized protein BJ171DRAFT_55433 [Polychytrium aggregatum]|uniref:uncharacterized protein n=1 Tax=Polychytrium aggregatum TaxID=110093 RepID=UPI0022FF116F|nr:uncharacterized protein BJ171DRAFT_55433 [Polychytrium aggregatum]KAI9205949.1 hypothetical protein BJ171DRAFT_55433 [Polychytrium aggregatum]